MVAILVLATLVTRLRSQTGKSVSVSTQCTFFLSRFLIICPYKMVFKLSWSLFRKVLASLFSSFIKCFMFTSPKIAANNKVWSCYFNYWSRQTKRYIRLRIYSLKEKLITRYAFPIAYWRGVMTRHFFFTRQECLIMSQTFLHWSDLNPKTFYTHKLLLKMRLAGLHDCYVMSERAKGELERQTEKIRVCW